MAFSLALILLLSILMDWVFQKLDLPGFVGVMFLGFLLGPHASDCIAPNLLVLSSDLRLVALVVILLRAGFSIHLQSLRKFGFRLLFLAVIPSFCEALTVSLLAHRLLALSWNSSFTLGCILPAVSPAVTIPLMLRCIEEKRGTAKNIPNLILTAASLDNILNILVCNIFLKIGAGESSSLFSGLVKIPLAMLNGIVLGMWVGILFYNVFEKFNPRATKRGLVILAMGLLLVHLEKVLGPFLPFSGLLAIMGIGSIILTKREKIAHEIAVKLSKMWILAEILLFAVVGADFDPHVAWNAGVYGALIIFLGVLARTLGVALSLHGSGFSLGEKAVIGFAWLPKATVQAAMGAAPLLAMKTAGLPIGPGETILAIATLSIFLTAPAGAVLTKKAVDYWIPVDSVAHSG